MSDLSNKELVMLLRNDSLPDTCAQIWKYRSLAADRIEELEAQLEKEGDLVDRTVARNEKLEAQTQWVSVSDVLTPDEVKEIEKHEFIAVLYKEGGLEIRASRDWPYFDASITDWTPFTPPGEGL